MGVKDFVAAHSHHVSPSKSLNVDTAAPVQPDGSPAYICETKLDDDVNDDLCWMTSMRFLPTKNLAISRRYA